ncbi:MAG: glutamine amidotransferase [Lachnospiraceae bacterium]|nr:glutamine amidotransferase [Lachnospiraceae bacterium]
MHSLSICHLYPEVLNLYGDRGNIICMEKRLLWRGIDCSVTPVRIGDSADFTKFDLFFIGGGQDFEQEVLLQDLKGSRKQDLIAAIEDGRTFLCVCGGYQMLGHSYETAAGDICEFLGAIDLKTVAGTQRRIDNFAFRLEEGLGGQTVVGYENHSGKTYLGKGVSPLGTIVKGGGNNSEDGTEGVHYKNVFGTYSHGPVLPKNPFFCDILLETALKRKYGSFTLDELDDRIEMRAHDQVLDMLLKGRI